MKNIEFETTSYESWINKIKKDVKSIDLEVFNFNIEGNLNVTPFSSSHLTEHFKTTNLDAPFPEFLVIETFRINNNLFDNRPVLNALENGVNAVQLILDENSGNINYDIIFKNIYLEMIDVLIDCNQEQQTALFQYLMDNDLNRQFRGAIFAPLIPNNDYDFPNLRYAFRPEKQTNYSGQLISIFDQIFNFLNSSNTSEEQSHSAMHIQICINLSEDFLSNIAFIKAARILWVHLMEGFDLPHFPLTIITQSTIKKDVTFEINCIHETIQLVSAITGGADGSFINAAFSTPDHQNFQNKTGINLYHLALLESRLRAVEDPLKGSYFIENAANSIAKKVWDKLTHKVLQL